MELKNYLAILRRWGWIMVLCTALAGITGYLYTSRQPPVYQSRSRYLIGPALDNPNVTTNDLRASSQIGQTYDELVTSRPVLQAVIDRLKLNTTPTQLQPQVNGTWSDTSQILSIRANAGDPDVAAQIANALGDELIQRSPANPTSPQAARRQQAVDQTARLQVTMNALGTEIDQLAKQVQQTTDPIAQRAIIVQLDQRRSQLTDSQRSYNDLFQMLQTSEVNQVTLVEEAVAVPDAPIAPDVPRTVLAAVIAGLVLGLAAMILLEYFTDVIYTPEMLRKVTGLTYLGGLARHKRLRGTGNSLVTIAGAETLAAESFRILRTNLQIAGTDRHLPSLLITSPSRGDGKSDIAANLAVSLARTGKRVILIDANLRRPQIASLFGLPDQDGLAHLLDNERMPELVAVPSVPGLSIIPAGGAAPNSSEILGSQHMYRLLQECKEQADVVLVDSPPLWYSDALALAPQMDGVLLVVSSGTTGRENTINAVESLRLVGAQVIGTVLNRVKAGPAYFYYPTYVANRPALGDSSTVSRRALPTTNAAARQRALGNQPRPASEGTIAGGLVEPSASDDGSDAPSARAATESTSLSTTATFGTIAPSAADTQASETEWSRALGEPVGAYGTTIPQSDAADEQPTTNGHRSATRRQNKR